MEGMLTVLTE